MMEDFATMAGIELVVIDAETRLRRFRQELNWSEVYYGLRNGFVA
jgi:L-arabinose isomerase